MLRVVRVVVPIAIVVVAIAIAVTIVKNKPRAAKSPPTVVAPTVVVVTAARGDFTPVVASTGVARAAREVPLAPELAGKVAWVAPSLVPGGRVKRGETLVRLDDRDLTLLVEEARARVSQAELALTLERSQGERAKRELALVGDSKLSGAPLALALREPQLKNAEVQVESAKNALARAELNLTRATLRAPLDAIVQSERVEVGLLASPQAPLATLFGTDAVWIVATIPVERLRTITIGEGDAGSLARVAQVLGEGRDVARSGRVVRLLSELEAETRTAQIVVEVARPFDATDGGLPLLPGAFVDVRIDGQPMTGVFVLPRIALVDDEAVWVVDEKDTLVRAPLDVVWRDRERVVVQDGLVDGARVVTTPMPRAVVGLSVKVLVAESGNVAGEVSR